MLLSLVSPTGPSPAWPPGGSTTGRATVRSLCSPCRLSIGVGPSGAACASTQSTHLRAGGVDVVQIATGGDPFHAPARPLYQSLGLTRVPTAVYLGSIRPEVAGTSCPGSRPGAGLLAELATS